MTIQETDQIELKEIFVPEIKKEVVAFANSDGGTIYIGISDDGKFVGLDNDDFTMQQASNAIRDGICPDVTMFTQLSFVHEEGKTAIKISAARGTKRPYYLRDKGMKPSGVYVRQGTSSVPASEDAIRKMIKESDGDSYEDNRSLFQELTFTYAKKELAARNIEFEKMQQRNIGVLTGDDIYTNLGLLLSDQCKHSVKLAIFQGTDKLVFKDRKEFSGSLFEQLEETYSAIDFYNATKATFQELTRTDERDYPPDAIREALLNAIVHRDYSFSGSTFINFYTDRIEFVSLGGLVSGLSLEAIMLGASQPRNEKLAALFYRMRLIEAYGTGIGKIISSYSGFEKKPVFENTDGAFRVILPNRHYEPVNDSRSAASTPPAFDSIMKYLKERGVVSRKELEKLLGLGTTRTATLLKEMIEHGLIVKTGNGKLTRFSPK
jgi:ATP-dependent DNA helicase RecG